MGFFKKLTGAGGLKDKLFKTNKAVGGKIRQAVGMRSKVDADLFEEMEEIFFHSDMGVQTFTKIRERLEKDDRTHREDDAYVIVDLMYEILFDIIKQEGNSRFEVGAERPHVVMVVGVNGTGKTTTIGKLAKMLNDQGKKTMLVAADTFRAAAVEQLEVWADRTNSSFIKGNLNADPASVCYSALSSQEAKEADVIFIDTAGRLHTKKELMEELKKIDRVIKKIDPNLPHQTLMVLDATTGQNALVQADIFSKAVDVNGIVMTKLDGSAKGGILIGIRDQFDIPIVKIGVGEGVEDLRDFDAKEYVDALLAE